MANEEWRPINDFPIYRVSNSGRVQNIKTGRVLKHGDDGNGYSCVSLWRDGKAKTLKLHRLVAEAFVPGDTSLEVNHIDGNKSHNYATNLEWSTRSANMIHAQKTGLWDVRRRVRIVETGDVYESETECARAIGGDVRHVAHGAAGLRKTHLGFHYEFV